MEEEFVMLEEVQVLPPEPAELEDPGYMLACGEKDVSDEGAALVLVIFALRCLSSLFLVPREGWFTGG